MTSRTTLRWNISHLPKRITIIKYHTWKRPVNWILKRNFLPLRGQLQDGWKQTVSQMVLVNIILNFTKEIGSFIHFQVKRLIRFFIDYWCTHFQMNWLILSFESGNYFTRTENNHYIFDNCLGFLKKEYYQLFVDYIMKFFDQYKENGLDMWAVTTGNEPSIGLITNILNFPSMGWTPESMANWVANFLAPTLASSTNKDTKIIALDDDKFLLPWFVKPLFENEIASNYTRGIGVHWYFENKASISVLSETHNEFPDKFILATESSISECLKVK